MHCASIPSPNTVYISPIVNRTADGTRIPEVGAGGGGGDLYQVHELELPDQSAVEQLEKLCLERVTDGQVLSQMRQRLNAAFHSKRKALPLDAYGVKDDQDVPLEHLVDMLIRRPDPADTATLPKTIVCPPYPSQETQTNYFSTSPTHATLPILNYAPSSPFSSPKTSSPALSTR